VEQSGTLGRNGSCTRSPALTNARRWGIQVGSGSFVALLQPPGVLTQRAPTFRDVDHGGMPACATRRTRAASLVPPGRADRPSLLFSPDQARFGRTKNRPQEDAGLLRPRPQPQLTGPQKDRRKLKASSDFEAGAGDGGTVICSKTESCPQSEAKREATPAGVSVVGRCGTVGNDSPDVLVGSEAEPRSCASFERKAGGRQP
jgi:hypothetical protein